MKILALESSTEACSVALWIDGEARERHEIAPRRHAQLLLPWAEALLAEAGLSPRQLDGLAFGRGPGSFTGVRIVTGVVQGIAFGADLPVAPVSTLAAMALGAMEAGAERVAAAIDARMNEIYWGCYQVADGGLPRPLVEERVVAAEHAPIPDGEPWQGIGSGWSAFGGLLTPRFEGRLTASDGECFPRARHAASLGAAELAAGRGVEAEMALPVYLRDQVAWQKS